MNLELKNKLKEIIRNNKILSYFYQIWCDINIKKMLKKKNKIFSRNGSKIFCEFLDICNSLNANVFLVYGTLLGYVRENGILKHDCDFDVGIFEEDYNDLLQMQLIKNGFKLVRQFKGINYNAFEQTYEKDGVSIDIFVSYYDETKCWTHVFYREINDSLKQGLYRIRKLDYPKAPLEKIQFLNANICIPSNYEIYLKEIYGDGWKIPDPNYDWRKGPKANCTLENIYGEYIDCNG